MHTHARVCASGGRVRAEKGTGRPLAFAHTVLGVSMKTPASSRGCTARTRRPLWAEGEVGRALALEKKDSKTNKMVCGMWGMCGMCGMRDCELGEGTGRVHVSHIQNITQKNT